MQIRPLGEDAAQLAAAFSNLPFVDFSRLAGWNEANTKGREAWSAWSGGECLGLVVLDACPLAELELSMAVAPGKRRRGIGTELLSFVRERCLSLKKTRLCVMIDRRNQVALAFFRARGFQSEPTELADHLRLFLCVESMPTQVPATEYPLPSDESS